MVPGRLQVHTISFSILLLITTVVLCIKDKTEQHPTQYNSLQPTQATSLHEEEESKSRARPARVWVGGKYCREGMKVYQILITLDLLSKMTLFGSFVPREGMKVFPKLITTALRAVLVPVIWYKVLLVLVRIQVIVRWLGAVVLLLYKYR